MTLCYDCVCVLSQAGVVSKRINGSSWFWHTRLSSAYFILRCNTFGCHVFILFFAITFCGEIKLCNTFGYLQNRGTFLWNVIRNFEFRKFLQCTSIALVWQKMDAQCNKLVTVVGRTKKCDSRRSMLARQFVTLSVHLCVQHDAREAARRAGPSATAGTCRNTV